MNNKNVLTILRIAMVGCVALGSYAYGKAQYYQGRIDVTNDLQTELDKVKDELYKKYNLSDKEAE